MIPIRTGDKFGEWTVLEKSDKPNYHTCECSCGVIKDVLNQSLRNGKSKSCGHAKASSNTSSHLQNTDKKVLGSKFGLWEPIERINETGAAEYLCECSCGARKVVKARTLLNGTSQSCGHVKSDYNFPDQGKMMADLQKDHLIENTNTLILKQKVSKNSKSGVKGVFMTKDGKYRAHIGFQGKRMYLGTHATLQDAIDARKTAEEKYHKPVLEKYDKLNKDDDK